MGNHRKPSALKLVHGTNRADRRNDLEPEPELLNDLDPPAHLADRTAAVWREIAPMLRGMQVLTVADRMALEILCDAVADYRHAREQRGDNFIQHSAKGSPMLNQWHVAQQMSVKIAESFMAKFAMDPVARSRVMINPQASLFPPADPNGAPRPDRFFN